MVKTVVAVSVLLCLNSLKAASQLNLAKPDSLLPFSKTLTVLPQNFYNQHLSFVCKKESQLQKSTNLNLYLRLGSKDYVDYMERKPNAKKHY